MNSTWHIVLGGILVLVGIAWGIQYHVTTPKELRFFKKPVETPLGRGHIRMMNPGILFVALGAFMLLAGLFGQ